MAEKSSRSLLFFDVMVKKMEQLVYFMDQISMVNGKSDKKKWERNVLFSKFSENIAHGLSHEGKRFSLSDKRAIPGFFNIRTGVIATEKKIVFTKPLYDDLIGLNVAHCSFLFSR